MNKYNYLIEGNDYVLIQDKIKTIIKDNNFSEVTPNTYDLNEVTLESALEDLDTYGLLSNKKIIIITNFDKIKTDEDEENLKHLLKYLEQPLEDNLLILVATKLDDRKKITKDIKKLVKVIEIEIDTEDFIKSQLSNYKYDKDVITRLINLCLDDGTKIYNECQKLKNYCYDTKKITIEDVDNLVVKKLGDSNEIVFSLIRYIAEKDIKHSIKLYRELLEYNFEPLAILALLESQYRIIYQVKELTNIGLNNDQIAEKLGEKVFRIKKTRELISYYTINELHDIFIKLADIDLRIKTSGDNGNFLLEQFIINL